MNTSEKAENINKDEETVSIVNTDKSNDNNFLLQNNPFKEISKPKYIGKIYILLWKDNDPLLTIGPHCKYYKS